MLFRFFPADRAPWRQSGALTIVALLLPAPLLAQAPVEIQRISASITIDGRPDEPAWEAVTPFPLTTFLPVAGKHPNDSSEVRLAYDDKYLYASARFWVSDPSAIQSTTLGRDQLGPDDRFRIMLDTYNDNRTGVGFLVTPSAARSDYDMTDDGSNVSNDWNTYWDAATARDARGWYAEMRIPFSSLRFRSENGQVIMGLIVLRVSAKTNEWSTYPALSPRESNAIWRASVAQKIVFRNLKRPSPAYVTPYALGKLDRTAALQTGPAARWSYDHGHAAEFGGDFKYGLTDDLTLDVTGNTDFAQVEADDQRVNLSRFSLFFPEKRQFFLERAGSFDFSTTVASDGSQVFYSRQIGLAADGTPLRLYGGARLVGRAGPLDVGALNLQVDAGGGLGTENMGVFRLRRRVRGDGSYVGAILTSRLGAGHHNLVSGADAQIRAFGNDFLSAAVSRSLDDQQGSGLGASQARFNWARRSSKGLIYSLTGKWAGPDYRPRLGFESHQDYAAASLELDYKWINSSGSYLQPSFWGWFYRRNSDGALDAGHLYPYLEFGLPSGLTGWFAWRGWNDDLQSPLTFSSTVIVPPARYFYQQGEVYVASPTGARLGYRAQVNVGGFYDGKQVLVDFTPTWSISPHLTLGGEYQLNRVRFPTRGTKLNADVGRFRIKTAWNTRLSADFFIQRNSVGRIVVGNCRIRYQFSEGHDLYLVYNDQLNVDRARLMPSEPELPFSQARALIVKYSYTFTR